MSELRMVVRELPKLISPTDTDWNWKTVNEKLRVPRHFSWQWWVFPFRSWNTVLAPKGTSCAVTTIFGEPIFRYKVIGGFAYGLEPEPSPGFPGS